LSGSSEREADRVSERVASKAEGEFPLMNAGSASDPAKRQRQPANDRLRTGLAGPRALRPAELPPVVAEGLDSPGRPIDAAPRALLEPRFGWSLAQVRIHTGEKAAESAHRLSARAYAVGRDVVFAAGEYAPATQAGIRLLAHELAHVVQQTSDPCPMLRRSPKPDALKDYSTRQKVWDKDAKAVDLAIAQSATIAKFPPKHLIKESGNVDTEDAAVFDKQYTEYAKGLNEKPDEIAEDLKTVGGFTDRKAGKVHLLNHVSDVEAALHEAIHLNSQAQFQNNFGHYMNEGVTEHFTRAVLAEQNLQPGQDYPNELAMAEGLIADLGEDLVGQAYFQGKMDAYQKVLAALSHDKDPRSFTTWHDHVNSSDRNDWKNATAQLHAALSRH